MKNVLSPPASTRRKLAFWRTESPESLFQDEEAEREDAGGRTLTEEQIQDMIASALERQRTELRAEFSAALRQEVASFSKSVEELYHASVETQKQLLECSRALRQEMLRFADDLGPRVEGLESVAGRLDASVEGLDASVEELQGTTSGFMDTFSERVAELGESIETTNHSLFALHKGTGQRIDELVERQRRERLEMQPSAAQRLAALVKTLVKSTVRFASRLLPRASKRSTA